MGADRRRNVLRYELALRNEARRLLTDGGFRPDGTFVAWPAQHTARSTEAFCRAVLRLFVRLELFDADQAAGMLAWPHSGFHVHTAVWVPEDDRAFATRLARYCARNPVALERLTYDRTAKAVTYRSDKSEASQRALKRRTRWRSWHPDLNRTTSRADHLRTLPPTAEDR